jgi:hypothetical protein
LFVCFNASVLYPSLFLFYETIVIFTIVTILKLYKWKMIPIESTPGMGRERTKENDGGVNSTTMCYKNFCKYHNVLPVQ